MSGGLHLGPPLRPIEVMGCNVEMRTMAALSMSTMTTLGRGTMNGAKKK